QRSVHGINVLVVRDVIAEINLRRREAGGDPERVDAKIFQIVEFGGDAVQVADAVVVAIGKAAWVELIKNRVLPPLMTFRVNGFLLRGGERRQERKENADRCDRSEH